jgi:hypothetical protein
VTTGGGGVITTADSSGNLSLLSGATTVVAVTSTGATVTGTLAVSGAVTLTTALPVLQGGTGVTTSTGTGAGVHSVGPSISSAVMTTMASSVITSGTAVATTTGTSFDFTGIPSWVKRVTIICNEVSTNGASPLLFQIGDSGGIENTGYVSTTQYLTGGSGSGSTSSTAGFVNAVGDGATVVSGHMVITNISSNLWISSNTFKGSPTYCYFGGGSKTLSATLDRVRITTVNGTDAFDAGSVNILYE